MTDSVFTYVFHNHKIYKTTPLEEVVATTPQFICLEDDTFCYNVFPYGRYQGKGRAVYMPKVKYGFYFLYTDRSEYGSTFRDFTEYKPFIAVTRIVLQKNFDDYLHKVELMVICEPKHPRNENYHRNVHKLYWESMPLVMEKLRKEGKFYPDSSYIIDILKESLRVLAKFFYRISWKKMVCLVNLRIKKRKNYYYIWYGSGWIFLAVPKFVWAYIIDFLFPPRGKIVLSIFKRSLETCRHNFSFITYAVHPEY